MRDSLKAVLKGSTLLLCTASASTASLSAVLLATTKVRRPVALRAGRNAAAAAVAASVLQLVRSSRKQLCSNDVYIDVLHGTLGTAVKVRFDAHPSQSLNATFTVRLDWGGTPSPLPAGPLVQGTWSVSGPQGRWRLKPAPRTSTPLPRPPHRGSAALPKFPTYPWSMFDDETPYDDRSAEVTSHGEVTRVRPILQIASVQDGTLSAALLTGSAAACGLPACRWRDSSGPAGTKDEEQGVPVGDGAGDGGGDMPDTPLSGIPLGSTAFPVHLRLQGEAGDARVVEVPAGGTVGDLLRAVERSYGRPYRVSWRGAELGPGSALLADLGLGSQAVVDLAPPKGVMVPVPGVDPPPGFLQAGGDNEWVKDGLWTVALDPGNAWVALSGHDLRVIPCGEGNFETAVLRQHCTYARDDLPPLGRPRDMPNLIDILFVPEPRPPAGERWSQVVARWPEERRQPRVRALLCPTPPDGVSRMGKWVRYVPVEDPTEAGSSLAEFGLSDPRDEWR